MNSTHFYFSLTNNTPKRANQMMEFLTDRKHLSISEKYFWSSNVEQYFHKLFNKITLCPIVADECTVGVKFKVKEVVKSLSILAIIYTCIHTVCLMVYPFFASETESFLNIWSIEMNIIMTFATTLTILIETQMTHGYLIDFLLLKQKIEHDLRILCASKEFEVQQYTAMKIYTRILIGFTIFSVLVFIMNAYRYSIEMLIYTFCLVVLKIVGQCRLFQHQLFTGTLHLYIKLIRIKYEQCVGNINQHEAMARLQNCRHFTMNSRKIFNELILSIRVFATIYRMANLVNKIFGVSILVLLLQEFVQLLTLTFWVYLKLYHHDFDGITGLQNKNSFIEQIMMSCFASDFAFRSCTSKFCHVLHIHFTLFSMRKLFERN